MARKQVVLLIVEGPTDRLALGELIQRVLGEDRLFVSVVHGDLTTRSKRSHGQIEQIVTATVAAYLKQAHVRKTDLRCVVQLTDTDGAFIPPSAVVEEPDRAGILYTDDALYTAYPDSIRARNRQKSANLRRLRQTGILLGTVPYRIYYMSRCLDHVLYNKPNSTPRQKENDAFVFARQYRNDLPGFLSFLCDSPFSVMNGYEQSWEYVEGDSGKNSLRRATNLGLFLRELVPPASSVSEA